MQQSLVGKSYMNYWCHAGEYVSAGILKKVCNLLDQGKNKEAKEVLSMFIRSWINTGKYYRFSLWNRVMNLDMSATDKLLGSLASGEDVPAQRVSHEGETKKKKVGE